MSDFKTFYTEGKLVVDSGVPGPRVAFIAGIHGNEPCGIEAFKQILDDFKIMKGSVTFLLGSRKAIESNVRAYECNLNRMFRDEKDLIGEERASYEYEVSRNLMGELQGADILLDIHSSSATNTKPFVICESNSFGYAQYLPVETIVNGLDALHPGGTDGYMNSLGKNGMCIECGSHNNPKSVEIAIKAIYSLLGGLGMISLVSDMPTSKQERIQVENMYRPKREFRAVRSFGDFERLEAGTLIGYDGEEELKFERPVTVLFVSESEEAGGEAFVYGEEIKTCD